MFSTLRVLGPSGLRPSAHVAGVRFQNMIALRLTLYILFVFMLQSCVGVTHNISSVPSLEQSPSFDTEDTYSYFDDEVSRKLKVGSIDLYVSAYNSAETSNHLELFFIPIDKTEVYVSEAGKTPFKVEVWVKGKAGAHEFSPYSSRFNGSTLVSSVMHRDPDPNHDCRSNYVYYEWQPIDKGEHVLIPDRKRNLEKTCYTSGWAQYLLEFNATTPKPESSFKIELFFTDKSAKNDFSQEIFFNGAKFKSVVTH